MLRPPRAGDGQVLNAAIRVSHEELVPWLPWAGTLPSVDESEAHCRRQQARFILREDFVMLVFLRGADGCEGELVGGTGLHRIDWALRKFEIGYWRKTGCGQRGLATEAVRALARLAFDNSTRAGSRSAWTTQRAQLEGRRARRLHARGAAALRLGRRRSAAAQHADLRARARRRGADGREGRVGARERALSRRRRAPGEKRSTASVTMPSMPRARAGSLRRGR